MCTSYDIKLLVMRVDFPVGRIFLMIKWNRYEKSFFDVLY